MGWMTAANLLTPEEIKIIELLRPSDGTIRALWQDHDGNQIMMVQWSKAYLEKAKVEHGVIDIEDDHKHQTVPEDSQLDVHTTPVHYCEQHRVYEFDE